ncbi:hypothetical protein [Halothermothrix orenii]|nr:hypothetical protein [Halothermothrix orenii]
MKKTRFAIIKFKTGEKRPFRLILPVFLISFILFFIPSKTIKKYANTDFDVKQFFREVRKKGKGTKIKIKDRENVITIELK